MSKGDGIDAGKHNAKTQSAWFKDIAVIVLQGDASGQWKDVHVDKLAPLIRNRVNRCVVTDVAT